MAMRSPTSRPVRRVREWQAHEHPFEVKLHQASQTQGFASA